MNRNANVLSASLFAENVDDFHSHSPEWLWAYCLATIGHARKASEQSIVGLKGLINLFKLEDTPSHPSLEMFSKMWKGSDSVFLPPILAGTAWSIYDQFSEKEQLKPLLEEVYDLAFTFHHDLYAARDIDQNGLVISKYPVEVFAFSTLELDSSFEIYDPFYHALLCWSNDALIKIGGLLGKDLKDVIEWNELTIYSTNEVLWHPVLNSYIPYDMLHSTHLSLPLVQSVLALFGNMATQDQVELLYPQLESQVKDFLMDSKDVKTSGIVNYTRLLTLLQATLAYDFDELSQMILNYLSQLNINTETDLSDTSQEYVMEGLNHFLA